MGESESILNSIKKMLGFEPDYTAFDLDIVTHINSVFSTLHQIGAAPVEGFYINNADAKWTDFFEGNMSVLNIKTYVYLKVRLLFDPPATSFAIDSTRKAAEELEWRLSIMEIVFNPNAYTYGEAVISDGTA